MIYKTKSKAGVINGKVITIWDANEPGHAPRQVYVTTVAAGMAKGPHQHSKRIGRFFCIVGEVRAIVRDRAGRYVTHILNSHQPCLTVPAGDALQFVNDCDIEAYIIAMPSDLYDPNDEQHVSGWDA